MQVVSKIEDLTRDILQDLEDGWPLSLPMLTRASKHHSQTSNCTRNYAFPASSWRSAWRFTVGLRILDTIHETLIAGKTISKRDIYYQDPQLFGTQAIVDRFIDDIAFTFSVSRRDLNVAAESKGLVAGALSYQNEIGLTNHNTFMSVEGASPPITSRLRDTVISPGHWPAFLLVIEKKATFHTLSRASFHILHNCILLTGQGYPDLATRAFLYHFHTNVAPGVPCYALVDFDPDGLNIYSVYGRGSKALAHEKDLAVPDLKLLGLRSDDALCPLVATEASADQQASQDSVRQERKLMYLTIREIQRARGLLSRLAEEVGTHNMDEQQITYMRERWDWIEPRPKHSRNRASNLVRELQVCLMMGYKVEIQTLDQRPGGLEGWLLKKIVDLE